MSTAEKISELKIMSYVENVKAEDLKAMIKELLLCQNAKVIHFAGLHFSPGELQEVYKQI